MDWIAIPLGIIALISLFAYPYDNFSGAVIFSAGIMGVLYIIYALFLWFIRRADFDWRLINGHFLRKVICVVLLMPFTLIILSKCAYIGLKAPQDLINAEYSIDTALDNSQKSFEPIPQYYGIYYHFIDPGNQHMSSTTNGRIWAAVISILGIFLLNGLLVSSIIGWVDRRKEMWKNGDIRYNVNHLGKYQYAIIIGANEIVISVIKNLLSTKKEGEINYKCEGNNKYIILHTCRDIEKVRTELASYLNEHELKKVIIYKGLRDSISELAHLFIEYSSEIYILGESSYADGGEAYHDSMNMQCVNLIAKHLNECKKGRIAKTGIPTRKVCKVMFEYQTTYSIFQFSDISNVIKDNLVFIPFNRYESWSRKVIVENNAIEDIKTKVNRNLTPIHYTPLDGTGITENDNTHVHLIIVGMSNMGISMGIEAMHQAHYLNFAKAETFADNYRKTRKDARRTRITFIDSNADKEMSFFKGRYANLFNLTRNRYIDKTLYNNTKNGYSKIIWNDPLKASSIWNHLSNDGDNFIDLEIEFIKGEIESEHVRDILKAVSTDTSDWVNTSKLTIAICLTQAHQAIAASLYLPLSIYNKAQEIWVYQKESADIILNLYNTEQEDKRYKKLRPFGMLYGEYMSDRSLYLKAMLANGAYDLSNIKGLNIYRKESYKKLRESWKILPLDKKFSNKYFIDSIPSKLRALGNNLSFIEIKKALQDNRDTLARCEHNRWNVQQLLLGYSACTEQVDKEFRNLNTKCSTQTAKEEYRDWKKSVNWEDLTTAARNKLQKTDSNYHKLAKGKFDTRKRFYKEGPDRMHPNICEYNHLDYVDSGAKDYDIFLNNSIYDIIQIVPDQK